ncbi:MAG: hypothetical protein U0228_03785 [Myxococcaceae bacterium]
MTLVWLVAYVVVGAVFLVLVLRRGGRPAQAVLVLVTWPLLAPSLLQRSVGDGFPVPPHLGEAELDSLTVQERDAVRRFQRHLASRLEQLRALKRLRLQSNGRITDRLDLVEAELTRDLEGGRALLEELADRVALAKVASIGLDASQGPDRLRLEALIARADALVQATADR